MTEDQHITQAAAYAAVAYRNGDDTLGAYWEERCVRLSDQREAMQRRAAFDALKGSPDHSGLSAAEHAHIHSDTYTARLGPRLRNA